MDEIGRENQVGYGASGAPGRVTAAGGRFVGQVASEARRHGVPDDWEPR